MAIREYLEELESLQIEIKRLSATKKKLDKKANEVQDKIIQYLEQKDLPGVKYNGVAVVVEEKQKRGYKKAKDKEKDALDILTRSGMDEDEAKTALAKILEARRGAPTDRKKLKIVKNKK